MSAYVVRTYDFTPEVPQILADGAEIVAVLQSGAVPLGPSERLTEGSRPVRIMALVKIPEVKV